jgi:phage replication-related protein YjqB (UPF0714/DUF867 family)
MEAKVYKARSDQEALLGKSKRCSLSETLAQRLGINRGRHIRIDAPDRSAYYIVKDLHEKDYPIRMAKAGRKRIGVSPDDQVTFSSIVPMDNLQEAKRTGGFSEALWDDGAQDTLILQTSHGGDVEFGTDDVVERAYKMFQNAGLPVSAWMAKGYNTSPDKNSSSRWHLTKLNESIASYPGLAQVSDRQFDHCISFHVQGKDSDRDAWYIGVGGNEETEIRQRVAEGLQDKIGKSARYEHDSMKNRGVADWNTTNFLAKDGGLQIEMTPMTAYKYRRKVAMVIFDVYSDIIET